MENILISGINGFVGKNLSSYFIEKQYNVYGLSRNISNRNSSFSWENLEEIKSISIQAFIHLAGKAHDLKKTSSSDDYFTINTDLTKRLFDCFLKSKANDFIYFSSVKSVADQVKGVLTEDIIPNPTTPYGKSKQLAEHYLIDNQPKDGKRLFIIRPCMIHGPGNKGNLNLLFKMITSGIPYPLSSFTNKRSFLSISNLCYIIEKLLSDKTIPGGIYNVADDEALSTNNVVELISEATGAKLKLWKINPLFVKAASKIGDKFFLPLNSERLKKLTENYVVSNDKIKHALGIANLPITASQGLLTTFKSFV